MLWRAILDPTRLVRVSALTVLLSAWGYARGAEVAPALTREGPPPVERNAGPAGADGPAAPRIEVTETEIRTDPPASPGARLGLEAGKKFQGMRYHWFQVEGPAVEIPDPSRPSIQVTIPGGADRLGFVLVAARADLVRLVRVNVPVPGSPSRGAAVSDPARPRANWGARASGRVKADAGDDQVGLVGHRVTLNGARSVPGDGKSSRWLQVAGPAVVAPEQQGAFFSFVPAAPGTYRFLLVVAGDGEVSEPDEVSVLVGSPPAAGPAAPVSAAPVAAAGRLPTPEQVLAGALPRLTDARRVGSDVADVLEAVSGRVSLYSSFAVLQNELARRLDVVIPDEPSQRAAWTQYVFGPLTAYTAEQIQPSGLDLGRPQSFQQPLTTAQQERLHDHFQSMARAFRAVPATR